VRLQRAMQPNREPACQPKAQQVSEAQARAIRRSDGCLRQLRIEGGKDGKYNVTWFREGFSNAASSVEVRAAIRWNWSLRIAPLGRVTGRVLDGRGPGGGRQTGTLRQFGLRGAASRRREWRVRHKNLGSGTYTLMAYAPDEWDPRNRWMERSRLGGHLLPGIVHADSARRIWCLRAVR